MKKKLLIFLVIFPGMIGIAYGQMIKPTYRQFFFNPYLLNPAFVGINEQPELNMVYKKKMANIDGAPVTTGITLQIPTRDRVQIGLKIISDRQILLRNTSVMGTFGYVVPISEKESLRFGLSAGYGVHSLKLTADELATNDPAILNAAENNHYFDGNFGVVYTASGLRLGFTMLEMINPDPYNSESFGEFSLSNLKNMLFSASYRFNLDPFQKFSMEPYALFRFHEDIQQRAWEAASVFYFKDLLWSGISYHQHNGPGIFFGMNVKDNFAFSYNYEFPPFESNFLSFSSHELQLSLKLKKKTKKKTNQRF